MIVFVVMRNRAVLSVHASAGAALDAAQDEPHARVVMRQGVHPWWRRPVDWTALP